MRHFYLPFSAAVLLLLAAGCAPKVLTRVQQSYPAAAPDAPVTVFGVRELVPDTALLLGSVVVKDTGFSTNCTYEQVIRLASNATRKVGGNALHLVYHHEPSLLGGTCHRIGGEMLYIPSLDSMLRSTDEFPAPRIAPIPARLLRPAAKVHRTTLHVTPGYGFIASKMEVLHGITGNFKKGFHLDAGIDRVSRAGLGGGIRYAGLFTEGAYEHNPYLMRVHYIGPEFILRPTTRSGKWGFHFAAGFGYGRYTEQWKSESEGIDGFGYHISLGAEYRITPHIGVGIQTSSYAIRFKAMDELVGQIYNEKTKGGIQVVSVNGGLRFYF